MKSPKADDSKWPGRFVQSLQRWSQKKDTPECAETLTGSLDHKLETLSGTGAAEDEERTSLLRTAYRAIVLQQLESGFHEMQVILEKCESTIEHAMLLALTIVGRQLTESVSFRIDELTYGDREYGGELILIEPQAQLGEYRVDFLLTLDLHGPDFDNLEPIPEKLRGRFPGVQTIPGSKHVQRKMVIECDGHDFHERTKEQASRDRQRDRMLQSLGYVVYRYTGSDIWADVFRCAHEAISTLHTAAMDAF